MSRLAFGVRRLAFRHQRPHFYSNEDFLRDESGALLAVENPEQACPPSSAPERRAHDGGWSYRTERQTPNPERQTQ
jgi:hypothetical protein